MKASKALINDSEKKEQKSWSTRFSSGKITKAINVDKLDNTGFLVTINVYGENKKGKYIDTTRKLYSETNPLQEEVADPIDSIISAILPNN